jgi:hypothetical protein
MQRAARARDESLSRRVSAIKSFQHRRFSATYADFLTQRATAPASRFFLDELYGPQDFSLRDAQFRRVVPGLAKFFPNEVSATVLELGRLHAMSEELDSAMGAAVTITGPVLDAEQYGRAWRIVGRVDLRDEQIRLMLAVGLDINRFSRKPLLRSGLVLMRGPAAAAGFGALQAFLESGLSAFRALEQPSLFLKTISEREMTIAADFFRLP